MECGRYQRSQSRQALCHLPLHLYRHVLFISSSAPECVSHLPRLQPKSVPRKLPADEQHLLRWTTGDIPKSIRPASGLPTILSWWPNATIHVARYYAAGLWRTWWHVHSQSDRQSQRQCLPFDRSRQQNRCVVYFTGSQCTH